MSEALFGDRRVRDLGRARGRARLRKRGRVELLSHTKVLIETDKKHVEVQIINPRGLNLEGDIELRKTSKEFPTVISATEGGVTTLTATPPRQGHLQLDCDIGKEEPDGGSRVTIVMTYCIRRT